MDLLVFFILFLVTLALFAAINYYYELFSQNRTEYKREELLDLREMAEIELHRFFPGEDKTIGYLVFGIGVFIGFILSYLGGLYTNHFESYFFHSAILPLIAFFLIPYLKDQFLDVEGDEQFLYKVFQNETGFFLGFAAATAAQILAIYGLYHGISFLWAFLNYVVILVLMILKINEGEIGEKFSLKKSGAEKKQ